MNLPWNRGVYVLRVGDHVKVGASTNVTERLKGAGAFIPPGAELVCIIACAVSQDPLWLEKEVHLALQGWHVEREWFHWNDHTLKILEAQEPWWMEIHLSNEKISG